MNSADLMEKATRAVASARLLLAAGDVDGACNRAYYGMFDAGRAALMWAHAPVDASITKTHSGLISAFGLHLVKTEGPDRVGEVTQSGGGNPFDCRLFGR